MSPEEHGRPTPDRGPAGTSNRRKHPRYPLGITGTAWCLTRIPAGPFTVRTSNISLSGLMLHASADPAELLEEGDKLLFGFPDPASGNLFALKGRIAWKRKGLMNLLGSWAFGIEFYDTAESDIRKLHDTVANKVEPLPEPFRTQ